MRLIDADTLEIELESAGHLSVYLENLIDSLPTIDAVLVVRCKDCIYRYKESDEGYICGISGDFTGDNEFCNKGKREDKGNEN